MNNVWPCFGITDEDLDEKAEWLSRDHPRFPGHMVSYFRTAGHLLRFTREQFTVLPLVFVQTVIGLEKVLRLVYEDPEHKRSLSGLLQEALKDGRFEGLEEVKWRPQLRGFRYNALEKEMPDTSLVAMVTHIPKLRNDLLHGEYMLSHELLDLALYVRRMVDALIPYLPKSRLEEYEEVTSEPVN